MNTAEFVLLVLAGIAGIWAVVTSDVRLSGAGVALIACALLIAPHLG